MPKRTRKDRNCISKIEHNFSVTIKTEYVEEEEAYIKTEPVYNDYEIDPMHIQSTKTVILNENDNNKEALEHEIGLVSELEIIKTELDVDEGTVNSFREELKRMSIDTAPKPLSKKCRNNKDTTNTEEPAKEKKKKKKNEEKLKTVEKSVSKDAVGIKVIKKKATKKCVKKPTSKKIVEPLEIVIDGKKMVKCPFCDKTATTRDRSLIKEHIRLHTGETPFKCNYCRQKFSVYGRLRDHIESQHKKKRLKCQLCKRIFYETDEFRSHELKCVKRRTFECHLCHLPMNRLYMHSVKEHMRIHHTGENAIGCAYCSEKFVSNCRLSSHIRRCHPEEMPYKCSNCDATFQDNERCEKHQQYCLIRRRLECYLCQYSHRSLTIEGLKLHIRKHTGEKPHQCHLCHKFYPRSEALAQHLQRHRETFKLKCSMCHRRFMNNNELEKHESICRKRRYECHLCGFTEYGLSFNKFHRHMARHTGIKNMRCNECSKSFTDYRLLGDHIFKSHPRSIGTLCPNCRYRFNSKSERDAHQSKCTKRRIECYICQKWTRNSETLQTHMTLKHTGAQNFQCNICSRKYYMKHNLDIHMKSHTKVGLVKCQYCSKTFSDIKYTKKHEFICKKVYECYLCKKTFRRFVDLHGFHMKTHLGTKPYDCRHCSKSTGSVRCYNLHVIDFHLHLYKFQCNICNGFIQKRKDFRQHQKTCMKPIRQSQSIIYFHCSLCRVGLARLPELRNHILNGECKNHPKKVR